jgi:hypothetical protein
MEFPLCEPVENSPSASVSDVSDAVVWRESNGPADASSVELDVNAPVTVAAPLAVNAPPEVSTPVEASATNVTMEPPNWD